MRSKYTLVSKNWYIDEDKMSFVEGSMLNRPSYNHIPFYYENAIKQDKVVTGYEIRGDKLKNIYTEYKVVDAIKLRGVLVTYDGYDKASISFYDNRKKKHHEIDVITSFQRSIFHKGNRDHSIIQSWSNNMCFDNSQFSEFKQAFSIDDRSFIKPIVNLAQRPVENTFKSSMMKLNYGLSRNQFKILYKGNQLDGESYVYLSGTWGIILQDNLYFDALFTIGACYRDTIEVSKFIYTSNPYIVKVITLL